MHSQAFMGLNCAIARQVGKASGDQDSKERETKKKQDEAGSATVIFAARFGWF